MSNKSRREFLSVVPAVVMAGGAAVVGMGSPAPGVEVQDEGTVLGRAKKLDFTGGGVTASLSGDKATINVSTGAGSDSLKVKVSSADTTEDFLNPKILIAGGLTKSILNPGANEQLQIDSSTLLIQNPSSSARNTVEPGPGIVPLTLKRSRDTAPYDIADFRTADGKIGGRLRETSSNISALIITFPSSGAGRRAGINFQNELGGESLDFVSWDPAAGTLDFGEVGLAATRTHSSLSPTPGKYEVNVDHIDLNLVNNPILPSVVPASILASTGIAGASPFLNRADHRHGVSLATLVHLQDVAETEDLGTATTLVRGDHRHAHGSGYLPNAHHNQSHSAADHSGDIIPNANQDFGAFYSDFSQIAAPADPAVGIRRLFVDSGTSKLSVRTSGGSTVSLEEQGGMTAREALEAVWDDQITKTNIGTAYVDIYNGIAVGRPQTVDFTGMTTFDAELMWDKVGTGTQAFRVIDADNSANVLFELTNVVDGENDAGGPTALPAWATGKKRLKPQAKSTTSTDDPIFFQCVIRLKA